MELIPAIDILDGKVVRLYKGKYDQVTVYSEHPQELAARFVEAGASRLHLVDLDGAREGQAVNTTAVQEIVGLGQLQVQIGGGIRNAETAKRWLDLGASRVVMGTAVVKQPDVVRDLCHQHPNAVVVALDAHDQGQKGQPLGEVAVEGWLERSGQSVEHLATEVDSWGIAAILFTCIDRDGTRGGPDIDTTLSLQNLVKSTVIASGGIGNAEHIRELATRGVRAAVCGRALVSGELSLEQAFAAASVNEEHSGNASSC